jgi:RimJ/RimL family protein N-acetyltransferase
VELRLINRHDLELLLAWRRLLPPNTTKGDQAPTWEEHLAWYGDRDGNSDFGRADFVIIHSDRRVGTVAANLHHDGPWISINIAEPDLQRTGIATAACNEVLDHLRTAGWDRCLAEIHTDNMPSQSFFGRLGFVFESESGDWQVWNLPLN